MNDPESEVNAIEHETGIDGRSQTATDRTRRGPAHQQSQRAADNALSQHTNGGDTCTQT
jgi:hypothetical protein